MSKAKSSKRQEQLQKLLTEYAEEANQWADFSQRASELNAERFVQTVVLGWLRNKSASLNELAHYSRDLGIQITGAALQERMTEKGVMLLAGVLHLALSEGQQRCRLPLKQLNTFTGIYITDSSQIALPPALACIFKGNKSNSMVKVQVMWDYLHGNLEALELEDGRCPDQKCRLPVSHAQAGTLQLFDLGYFKQEYLRAIVEQEAFFVSRYQSQTALYFSETDEAFELLQWLKRLQQDEAEQQVFLGERVKLPVRLLVRRLSPKVAAARRRKAKKKAHKQGKNCSAAFLALLGWDILLTNLAAETWTGAQVFDLYSLRFQIEWLFRVWKTQLGVDEIGNWRVERVLCQLYAHLIAAFLAQFLTVSWRWQEVEFSFLKLVQILQAHVSELMRCFAQSGWGIAAWFKRLEEDFRAFGRKTKRRKSPSTLQTIYNWGLA